MNERRVTADGRIIERLPDGTIVEVGQQQGVVLPAAAPPPSARFEAPQAEADINKTQAEIEGKSIDNESARMKLTREQRALAQKELNSAFQTNNVLAAIRKARKIAQESGGTGWGSMLSGVPSTDARTLRGELNTIAGNLSFDRLQQMRDESPTGGALGSVTERELELLASTVASLDQGADLPAFLERLDRIERSFIGIQMNALGIAPDSDEGRRAMKQDYGYTGVLDGEGPRQTAALADPNATQAQDYLPPEYQAAHLRYLRENWGNLDPRAYAAVRTQLDSQFGFEPDMAGYATSAAQFNQFAEQGGAPDQLGAIPMPPREMGVIEQGMNKAAQSAPGAFFANAGNAVGAGLPAYLSGEQRTLELLRDSRPVSSALGEMAGSALGAYAGGGVAGRLGASMLARPLGSELAHGTIYGATQDDNMMRGAATGALGSLAGSFIGQKVGQAFPRAFAGDAVARAEDAVPTVPELKEQAAGLYADVQAAGNTAMPDQTGAMFERARKILASQGRIGADGQELLQDGATKQGYSLLGSFADQTMSPVQAQTVRETLGEGLTSNVPKERRIASMLLGEFDDWAAPVMPGAEQAREVSRRYIQGQQLQDLAGLGARRGERLKGNDVADSTRTMFGQLDEKVAKGQAFFDEPTQAAISKVAQGDPFTNAMRALGKYGFGSVLPTTGMLGAGASSAFAQTDPVYMAIPAAVGAFGTAARKLAERRTLDAARNAEFTALGGPAYQQAMDEAAVEAALYGGRIGGGLFGSSGSMTTRKERELPRR